MTYQATKDKEGNKNKEAVDVNPLSSSELIGYHRHFEAPKPGNGLGAAETGTRSRNKKNGEKEDLTEEEALLRDFHEDRI
ncbi:MAG: hypothetical protein ACP5UH_00415 [Candidatus Micrarchaeia archaeon]